MSSKESFETELKDRQGTFYIMSVIGGGNFIGCFIYFVLHHSLTVLLLGILVGGFCLKGALYERVRINRLEFTIAKKSSDEVLKV